MKKFREWLNCVWTAMTVNVIGQRIHKRKLMKIYAKLQKDLMYYKRLDEPTKGILDAYYEANGEDTCIDRQMKLIETMTNITNSVTDTIEKIHLLKQLRRKTFTLSRILWKDMFVKHPPKDYIVVFSGEGNELERRFNLMAASLKPIDHSGQKFVECQCLKGKRYNATNRRYDSTACKTCEKYPDYENVG